MIKCKKIPMMILLAAGMCFAVIGCEKQQAGSSTVVDDGHGHAAGESCSTTESVPEGHSADDEHNHGEESGHADEVTLTTAAIEMNNIQVTCLETREIPDSFQVVGRVAFNNEQMAHVGTPVQGRVTGLKVVLGQQVKKGDVLAEIDSPILGEAQSDYLQKRTQCEVADSASSSAVQAKERAERLLATGGIGLGEFQKREAETSITLGTVQTARAAQVAAENKLHLLGMKQTDIARLVETGEVNSRCYVTAPIDGRVIEREITPGEMVGPEREALLVLANMQTLWILVDVPEKQLSSLKKYMHASVSMENSEKAYEGRVAYIAPELSRETRTVMARVELDGEHDDLLPGMFAKVTLTNDTNPGEPMLAVPESAVQQYEGRDVVFAAVDGEDNTFMSVPVKVGPVVNGIAPLLEGVEEGTEVVTEGAFVVKAEMGKAAMEGKTCSGH